MFAIDTNILVYANNIDSSFYHKAKKFVEGVFEYDDSINGYQIVGIPLQVCAEFINVITRETLETPLTVPEAITTIGEYIDNLNIPVILPKKTQLQTFLSLLEQTTTRKKVFDVFLAATLKDNEVEGLYTVNVDDFKELTFLKVINPLT
jgi:predicted nucleic acid-binding protein